MNTTETFHSESGQEPQPSHQRPVIVGLDIGTTKIAAIAATKNEYGKLEILGFGKSPSNGVIHGMVLNIDQTINAIEQAVRNCLQSNPNLEINEVYVGVAGHHIKSLQTRGDIVRKTIDDEIRQEEISMLVQDQYKTFIPAGDQIIDVIPQEFTVDNLQNIPNPIGYSGVKVGANFHIITGDRTAIKNIKRSVEKAGLRVKDLMLQPLASAAAVMCEQDLEAGVAIVDIGGGTTDLAVFYDGILKQTAVIPFGGENITKDIKDGLGVLKTQAEQMKVQFGSALEVEAKRNAFISIPGLKGMPTKEISVSNLAGIIQARMTEILEFVSYHLHQVGLNNRMLNGGIVLTGGGSQLRHLIQLTEYVTKLNARIGYPHEHLAPGYMEELAKPMYSTCLGLILKGFNVYENSQNRMRTTEAAPLQVEQAIPPVVETMVDGGRKVIKVGRRSRSISSFIENIKGGLIEIFKEDGDRPL